MIWRYLCPTRKPIRGLLVFSLSAFILILLYSGHLKASDSQSLPPNAETPVHSADSELHQRSILHTKNNISNNNIRGNSFLINTLTEDQLRAALQAKADEDALAERKRLANEKQKAIEKLRVDMQNSANKNDNPSSSVNSDSKDIPAVKSEEKQHNELEIKKEKEPDPKTNNVSNRDDKSLSEAHSAGSEEEEPRDISYNNKLPTEEAPVVEPGGKPSGGEPATKPSDVDSGNDTKGAGDAGNNSNSEYKFKHGDYAFKTVWICHIRSTYGYDARKPNQPQTSAGFAMEAINFIVPLCRMLPDNFGWQEEGDNDWWKFDPVWKELTDEEREWPIWKFDPVWKELTDEERELLLRCNANGKTILDEAALSKNDKFVYEAMIQFAPMDINKIRVNYPQLNNFDYVFCRVMYETNSVPKNWDNFINKNTDEAWVPSHFEKEVFETNGVYKPVTVIGEGFDTNHLNASNAVNERRLLCPSCWPDDYIFVSVSKFEDRKGFDHLLEAYQFEFKGEDRVCLALRASGLETEIQLPNNNVNGLRTCKIPRLPEDRYLNLYKSSDAFILATHGEGWGRTIMEAMAMGMPTLVPLWGGVTEYINESVSVPIKVEGLEKPPKTWPLTDKINYKKHHWAKVDVPLIQKSMRWVYEHQEEGRKIGERAKQHVWNKYTREMVAERAIARYQEVANQIGKKRGT